MTDSDRTRRSADEKTAMGDKLHKRSAHIHSGQNHKARVLIGLVSIGIVSIPILSLALSSYRSLRSSALIHNNLSGYRSVDTAQGVSMGVAVSSKFDVDLQAVSTASSSSNNNSSSATVLINGQSDSLDASGTIDKTYSSDNGNTNVHITVKNNSSTETGQ
jgi:hypothetical protein